MNTIKLFAGKPTLGLDVKMTGRQTERQSRGREAGQRVQISHVSIARASVGEGEYSGRSVHV